MLLLSSAILRASPSRSQPRFTWPDGKRSVRNFSSVHVKTPDASSVREVVLEPETDIKLRQAGAATSGLGVKRQPKAVSAETMIKNK
jgi:hypothetical protein